MNRGSTSQQEGDKVHVINPYFVPKMVKKPTANKNDFGFQNLKKRLEGIITSKPLGPSSALTIFTPLEVHPIDVG